MATETQIERLIISFFETNPTEEGFDVTSIKTGIGSLDRQAVVDAIWSLVDSNKLEFTVKRKIVLANQENSG